MLRRRDALLDVELVTSPSWITSCWRLVPTDEGSTSVSVAPCPLSASIPVVGRWKKKQLKSNSKKSSHCLICETTSCLHGGRFGTGPAKRPARAFINQNPSQCHPLFPLLSLSIALLGGPGGAAGAAGTAGALREKFHLISQLLAAPTAKKKKENQRGL